MKIRIRSNLETKRIEVDDSSGQDLRLSDLKEALSKAYNIPTTSMTFCWDISGEEGLWKDANEPGPDSTLLSMLNIKNGSLLYLCGRLEKHIVEKSYVDSTGSVISKGEHYNLVVDECDDLDDSKALSGDGEKETVTDQTNATSTTTTGSTTSSIAETDTNSTSRNALADVDEVMSAAYPPSRSGEDGVRAPDAARRMRLVDDLPYDRDYRSSNYLPPGVDRELLSPGMEAALRVMESAGTGRLPPSFNMDAQLTEAMNSLNDLDQANIAISMAKTRLDNLEQMEALEMARLESLGVSTSPVPPSGDDSHSNSRSYGTGSAYGSHEKDEFGNPLGTLYTGTQGLSSHSHAPASTNEALGVNQEVVDSLRSAGVSEQEILMELARLQDEAVASTMQQAEYTNRVQPGGNMAIPSTLSIPTSTGNTSYSSSRARAAREATGGGTSDPIGSPLGKLLQEVAKKREKAEAEIDAIIYRGEHSNDEGSGQARSRKVQRARSDHGTDTMSALRTDTNDSDVLRRTEAEGSTGANSASDPALERIRYGLAAILSNPKHSPKIKDRKALGQKNSKESQEGLAPPIANIAGTHNKGSSIGIGNSGRLNRQQDRQLSGADESTRDMVIPSLSSSYHDTKAGGRRRRNSKDEAPIVKGSNAATSSNVGMNKKSGSSNRRRRDQPLSVGSTYTPSFGLSSSSSLSTSQGRAGELDDEKAVEEARQRLVNLVRNTGSSATGHGGNARDSFEEISNALIGQSKAFASADAINYGVSSSQHNRSNAGINKTVRQARSSWEAGSGDGMGALSPSAPSAPRDPRSNRGRVRQGGNRSSFGENSDRFGIHLNAGGSYGAAAAAGGGGGGGDGHTNHASSYGTSNGGSSSDGHGMDLKDLDLTSVEEDDEIALAMMLSLSEQQAKK